MTEQTIEPAPIATFDNDVITDESPAPSGIPANVWEAVRVAVWTARAMGARAGNTVDQETGTTYRAVFRRREDADGVSFATSIVDVFEGEEPEPEPTPSKYEAAVDAMPLYQRDREFRALVAVEVAERVMRGVAENTDVPIQERRILAEAMHFTTITTTSLVKHLDQSDLIAAYVRREIAKMREVIA